MQITIDDEIACARCGEKEKLKIGGVDLEYEPRAEVNQLVEAMGARWGTLPIVSAFPMGVDETGKRYRVRSVSLPDEWSRVPIGELYDRPLCEACTSQLAAVVDKFIRRAL